ncbi:unnamed protein product, partial [Porites evermanni]
MVQYLTIQKSSLTHHSTILAFDSMENQIPSLAVLSGKNMTLQDQVHFLYDFPFATILKQPFFQCILDEILQSLTPHQLMQYAEDQPGNPHMTKKIVDELMSPFSLEGLELISRSFHVDHPLARALDFAIHKRRMSESIHVLSHYFMFPNWPYEGQISVVIPGNWCLPLKDRNLSAVL